MKTIRAATTFIFFILLCNDIRAQLLKNFQITDFKADSRNGVVGLSWKTEQEQDVRQYEIESSIDGKYFDNLGFVPARHKINGDVYEFENTVYYTDSVFYRLRIVDLNGNWLYTEPVLYKVNKNTAFFIYPSVISSRMINVFLNDNFDFLEVINMSGEVMLKQNLSGKTGKVTIPVSTVVSSGVYIVQLRNYDKTITQKIVIQ